MNLIWGIVFVGMMLAFCLAISAPALAALWLLCIVMRRRGIHSYGAVVGVAGVATWILAPMPVFMALVPNAYLRFLKSGESFAYGSIAYYQAKMPWTILSVVITFLVLLPMCQWVLRGAQLIVPPDAPAAADGGR